MPPDALTILHVMEPGGGGTMRHVLDLTAAQAAAGHRVHLVYSPLRLEPLFAPQLQALQNITLYKLPMRRAPHPSDIQNISTLMKIIHTVRPDILHAHSTKAGMIVRLAAARTKTPVLYTPHGLMTSDARLPYYFHALYGAYEKILSPLMRYMIVLSQQEFDCARRLGVPAARIRLGLNGTAPLPLRDRAAIRADWGLMPEEIAVGFVGRFAYPKNPQLAIAAFAKAAEPRPALHLVMIGDGPDREACRRLAQELNIQDRIIWLGAVEAKEFYAGLDMLVIPSLFEAMAYAFIEALHAGVPVISTYVGGSDRCVIDGQTGFIAAPDAAAIADKILQLADDAVLRDAMHFAARAHSQNFTLAVMYEAHEKIYRDSLSPHSQVLTRKSGS